MARSSSPRAISAKAIYAEGRSAGLADSRGAVRDRGVYFRRDDIHAWSVFRVAYQRVRLEPRARFVAGKCGHAWDDTRKHSGGVSTGKNRCPNAHRKRREKHSRRGYRPAEDKRPDREQHRDYQPRPPFFLEHKIALALNARGEDERHALADSRRSHRAATPPSSA